MLRVLSLALLLLAAAPASGELAARPPRLFALLVIDTNSNLGESVVRDRDNVRRILSEAFATRPHRLDLRVLQGARAQRAEVLGYYKALAAEVRPADTLLFYYSGHGATLPDGGGHMLTMEHDAQFRRQFLARAELRAAMVALNPRHSILLTDCRSKIPSWAKGNPVPPAPPATWPLIDTLFFHHSGVTDINGCQDDAFSLSYSDADGEKGGTFTLALVPLLCTNKGEFAKVFGADAGSVSWPHFAAKLRAETDRHYQSVRKSIVDDARADPKLLADVTNQAVQEPHVLAAGARAPQAIIDKTWMLGVEYTAARQEGRPVVYVAKVYPNTPAALAGLRDGDVVAAIDGVAVSEPAELGRMLENSGGRVRLELRRSLQTVFADVVLKPVKPPAPAAKP